MFNLMFLTRTSADILVSRLPPHRQFEVVASFATLEDDGGKTEKEEEEEEEEESSSSSSSSSSESDGSDICDDEDDPKPEKPITQRRRQRRRDANFVTEQSVNVGLTWHGCTAEDVRTLGAAELFKKAKNPQGSGGV